MLCLNRVEQERIAGVRDAHEEQTMTVRKFHSVAIAFMAAGLMSGWVTVSAQSNPGQGSSTTLPDAQIESNVLRALASAPELSSQNIQTSTVYGTVTLTGNVHDEAM